MTEERVAKLEERIDNFFEITTEYRKALCAKNDLILKAIDELKGQISSLPCPVRIEQTKGITLQLKALWALTGGMLLAIISDWVKLK